MIALLLKNEKGTGFLNQIPFLVDLPRLELGLF
jgi:hypothetical protein